MELAENTTHEVLEKQAKDAVKDSIQKVGLETGKEVLKNKDSGKLAADLFKEAGKKGTEAAWKDTVKNINPKNALKGPVLELFTKIVLDQVGWTRDSEYLFKAVNVGVEPRLSEAMKQLKEEIENFNEPLEEIQISVYGADWGASLACVFMHKLCKECGGNEYSSNLEWTLKNGKKIKLRMVFAGLLDMVGKRTDGLTGMAAGAIPYLGLDNALGSNIDVPRVVERAVHFVAAHEPYTRSYSLGGAKLVDAHSSPLLAERRQERVYPGMSCDISGVGLENGIQDRDMGIALVALQEMWRMARAAGVPFPDYEAACKLNADFNMAATEKHRGAIKIMNLVAERSKNEFAALPNHAKALGTMGKNQDLNERMLAFQLIYAMWLQSLIRRREMDNLSLAMPKNNAVAALAVAANLDAYRLDARGRVYRHVKTIYNQRINPLDESLACIRDAMKYCELTGAKQILQPACTHLFEKSLHYPPAVDGIFLRICSTADIKTNAFTYASNYPNLHAIVCHRAQDDGEDLIKKRTTEKITEWAEGVLKGGSSASP